MSGKFNWTKIEHERKLAYTPSPRSLAATNRQLAYISFLAKQKGVLPPKPPRTKHGAGQLIDQLLALPDAEGVEITPPKYAEKEKPTNPITEMVAELREHHPQLTPMAANSLVNLFSVIDPTGAAFTLNTLLHEDAPEDRDELIIHLLRRFLEEFAGITAE